MRDDREVVYLERSGGGALKWLALGAALGAGLALLFAPKPGRELRRDLGKRLKGLRELADEALEEFSHDPAARERDLRAMTDSAGAYQEELEVEPVPRKPERPSVVGAREELERRLAAARARRRQPVRDDEEPVA